MPSLPRQPNLPSDPIHIHAGHQVEHRLKDMLDWAAAFQRAFIQLWTSMVYVVNALSKVDTLANQTTTPDVDEIFFVGSDTYQQYVGSDGAGAAVGRVGGTTMGAIPFTEISDAAAPAANGARLYVRDTGGKTELVVRFATGAIQTIAI